MDARNPADSEQVILTGWIDKKPKKVGKGLVFGRLRDSNGDLIQLVDTNEPSLLRSLKQESAIVVKGNIEAVSKGWDLKVSDVHVVNESGVIGSQLMTGDTKEWPPQYRYLQLRSTEFQKRIQTRARVMSICRSILDSLNFIEVETPLLFKSTPEGAREFLVPTRKKGLMYALPQSPQQYKQLLMASGVNRYYQIARCFRDEDLRADRQPEFTQLDMEMSFANKNDVQRVIEQIVQKLWKEVKNQKFYTLNPNGDGSLVEVEDGAHFTELLYNEAIAKYGIDKPDLRSSLEIFNASDFAKSIQNPEFPVFEVLVLRGGLSIPELLETVTNSNEYSSRVPTIIPIESEVDTTTWDSKLTGKVTFTDIEGLRSKLDLSVGDILIASDRKLNNYENPTPLGKSRQLAISKTLAKGIYQRNIANGTGSKVSAENFVGSWVTEFPLFNPVELDTESDNLYPTYVKDKYVSTHHPFTMSNIEDYDNLSSDPLKVRGQHYDFVVNGVELGGGSTRIHDPQLQNYIFHNILQISNPEVLFGHLLTAFETGCPPHAGLALGFDRMTAMLCGTESIRDVIAFPKTITGSDPMIGSPSKSTPNQLKDYHIKVF